MKAFIFITLLAVASTAPIEDTAEVKAAKEAFMAAFAQAEAGHLAALAAAPAFVDEEAEVAADETAFQATFDAYIAGEIPMPDAPEGIIDEEPEVTTTIPEDSLPEVPRSSHVAPAVQGTYLEDTDEVKAAKEAFMAVFNAYANGEVPLPVAPVASVAPVEDEPAVAAVKAAFRANFDAIASGAVPLPVPVAPAHTVVPVVNAPAAVAAPVQAVASPHIFNGFHGGHAGYPYTDHNGYYGHPFMVIRGDYAGYPYPAGGK